MKNLGFLIIAGMISATAFATDKTDSMRNYVSTMQESYSVGYAMKDWKKEHLNLDLDQKFNGLLDAINNGEIKSTNEFHHRLQNIIDAMSDWHVNISFARSESSHLPFTIRSAEGRFFIVWIDRKVLPKSDFPFDIGDEVVSIGSMNLSNLVEGSLSTTGAGKEDLTARAFAELNLTRHRAARGYYNYTLPQGPTKITLKKKADKFKKLHETTLTWIYKKELVTGYNKDLGLNLVYDPIKVIENITKKTGRNLYVSPASLVEQRTARNKHGLGQKESFLPKFGKVLWEAEKENYYYAYMYRTEEGKIYGYFRIKDYMPYNPKNGEFIKKAKDDLEKIMKHFKDHTDGLVIDQLNNPGGDIFYGYFIASMLTDKVIETIPEREMLTPESFLGSVSALAQLEKIKTEEDLKKAFGGKMFFGGIKVTLDFVRSVKAYHEAVIASYNKGLTMTDLFPVQGIKYVRPHESIHYDKPVVLLINELGISAGDFFPALVQDNGLAKLFGANTSGAGGYIIGTKFPNRLGVKSFSITGSIALRKNGKPIEDLGVKPDVEYAWKVKDLTDGFKTYIKAVHDELAGMIKR